MPQLQPVAFSVPASRPVDESASSRSTDVGAGDSPASGVVTRHWVSDAEWGDIEEIVVYGDAA